MNFTHLTQESTTNKSLTNYQRYWYERERERERNHFNFNIKTNKKPFITQKGTCRIMKKDGFTKPKTSILSNNIIDIEKRLPIFTFNFKYAIPISYCKKKKTNKIK